MRGFVNCNYRATKNRSLWLALAIALMGLGCAAESSAPPANNADDDFPLSDAEPLYADAPADRGMSLPFDAKADDVFPERFDLMASQSPVRDQGRRGVCSIFSAIGLMESLYVAEGSIPDPDFSEQFLQWSVKFEVNAFQNESGSSSYFNLRSLSQFGTVLEELWPYESIPWGPENDEACTGARQPTRCYTNGTPPPEALAAQRFTIPAGRYINPSTRSIKGHMISTQTSVLVGGDFFYQSWNHGKSNLRISSDYLANGYVLSPNEEDIQDSSGDRRAGHSFVLIGWNDELSVPRVDGDGNPVLDEDGEPEMETGFYLFKNSWGTARFGRDLPNETSDNMGAPGFGWIAYRYVEEHLTAYVSGLPEVMVPEICNDAIDNDRNGLVDCADSACIDDPACMGPVDTLTNDTPVEIPDADMMGARSIIRVSEPGTITSLAVHVDVTHSYRGDLQVLLIGPDGSDALLFNREGGSADDLVQTFSSDAFNGSDAAGDWTLVVRDLARADRGTLNSWTLDITR